jgi:hypothetical protein
VYSDNTSVNVKLIPSPSPVFNVKETPTLTDD